MVDEGTSEKKGDEGGTSSFKGELRNDCASGGEELPLKICFPGGIGRKIYEALGLERARARERKRKVTLLQLYAPRAVINDVAALGGLSIADILAVRKC